MEWYEWFKIKIFYQYGAAYIGVRIAYNCLGVNFLIKWKINIFKALINFYLIFVIEISDKSIKEETPIELAIIPLILYFFSVLASITLESLYRKYGR